MILRVTIAAWLAVLSVVLGCGSGSTADEPTTGPIERTITMSRNTWQWKAVRHQVPLDDPVVTELVGLPVAGVLEIDADVTAPVREGRADFRAATGSISVRCVARCTIGDDATNWRPRTRSARSAAMLGEGIVFGHLSFGTLEARLSLAGGHAVVSHWRAESPDVTLEVSGRALLGREIDAATGELCIRYRPTDALKTRDARTSAALMLTGAVLADDGMFNIVVSSNGGLIKARAVMCTRDPASP